MIISNTSALAHLKTNLQDEIVEWGVLHLRWIKWSELIVEFAREKFDTSSRENATSATATLLA